MKTIARLRGFNRVCLVAACIGTFIIPASTQAQRPRTDQVIVKSASYGKDITSVDVGPAVCNPYTGCEAGMHGALLVCNHNAPRCLTPTAGDAGRIEETRERYYEGPEMTICFGDPRSWRDCGQYAVRETY